MTPQEKIDRILEAVESGKTVYISTATKNTKIDKKAIERFKKANAILFKADEKSMYMASGKKFVCIDYCRFTYSE
jgi:flagellar biosynthesis/type III secretory pathway chaperone